MGNIKGAWYLGGRMGSQEENSDIHKVAKLFNNQEKILKSSSISEIISDIHFPVLPPIIPFPDFSKCSLPKKETN